MIRLPVAGEEFGRYHLVEQLGHGGMGVVYAARDTDLGRDVALKLVAAHLAEDEEFRTRFQREATVLASLDSPHVIAIFEHGEHDGVLFLATQLVPGGDLQKRLARHGAFPPAVALDLLAQILEALQDAHRAGIVHRDIKPGNVLIRDRDAGLQAFLCDFGIATAPDLQHSRTGSVTGSLQYMPPERHQGESAGPAGDLYAAGCLLWALLTGAPPWVGTEVEIAMAHLSADVPTFPGSDGFTESLNAVIGRSMAKAPGDRYKSAAAMRRDVLEARDAAPAVLEMVPETAVRRSAVAPAVEKAPVRRRSAVVAALLSGGAVALVAMLLVFRDPSPEIDTEPAADGSDVATASSPGEPSAADDVNGARGGGKASRTPGEKGSKDAKSTKGAEPDEPTRKARRKPAAPPYRCWDGSRTKSLDKCGKPQGHQGLRYVFPGPGNCSKDSASSPRRYVLDCPYKGGSVRLAEYTSVSAAKAYYDRSYDSGTAWIHNDVHYGFMWSKRVSGDVVRSTRLYRDGPYIASVDAKTPAAHERGVDLLYSDDVRAPADFKGIRVD